MYRFIIIVSLLFISCASDNIYEPTQIPRKDFGEFNLEYNSFGIAATVETIGKAADTIDTIIFLKGKRSFNYERSFPVLLVMEAFVYNVYPDGKTDQVIRERGFVVDRRGKEITEVGPGAEYWHKIIIRKDVPISLWGEYQTLYSLRWAIKDWPEEPFELKNVRKQNSLNKIYKSQHADFYEF